MRFSIRDLLWLTALAALAVCWWLDHRRLTGRIADLEETITYISPSLPPPGVLDRFRKAP
jgi:hypothetical protein